MCAVGNDGRLSNIIKVVVCEVKFSSLHATHLFIVGMVYELAEGQHDSAVAFLATKRVPNSNGGILYS